MSFKLSKQKLLIFFNLKNSGQFVNMVGKFDDWFQPLLKKRKYHLIGPNLATVRIPTAECYLPWDRVCIVSHNYNKEGLETLSTLNCNTWELSLNERFVGGFVKVFVGSKT